MSSLEDFDDVFESIGKPKPVAELPQSWLPNGFYTLVFPCGTHKTIRIHTQKGGPMAGKRLVSLLIGPSNTDDYEAFGELTAAGFTVWKRWEKQRQAHYLRLVFDMMKGQQIEGHEIHVSKRCLRCNRTLTTPESLAAGIGPECATRG